MHLYTHASVRLCIASASLHIRTVLREKPRGLVRVHADDW